MSTPHPITPNVPPLRSQNLPNIRLDPFRFLNSHWNSEFEPWYWIFHILSLSAVYHQKYDTGGNKDGVDIPSLFNSVVGELNTADPGVLEYQDSHAAAWRDRKMRSLLRKVLWCDAERKKNKEVMGDRWCRKNSEEERFRRAVHVDHFLECLKIWHPGIPPSALDREIERINCSLSDPRPYHTHHGTNFHCHDMTCSWDDRYPQHIAERGLGFGYRLGDISDLPLMPHDSVISGSLGAGSSCDHGSDESSGLEQVMEEMKCDSLGEERFRNLTRCFGSKMEKWVNENNSDDESPTDEGTEE